MLAAPARLVPALRMPPCTPSEYVNALASKEALTCSRTKAGRTPSALKSKLPAGKFHAGQCSAATFNSLSSSWYAWPHAADAVSRVVTPIATLFMAIPQFQNFLLRRLYGKYRVSLLA